jgi:hypothetical protein
MNTKEIPLGVKVRDTISGATGTAIARTIWLNGCVRITVQPEALKDGGPAEGFCVDEQQIEVIQDKPAEPRPPRGGPMPAARRAADPTR